MQSFGQNNVMTEESNDFHHESLSEEASNILGEAKIVIPGVQTIFGFQLVAVFSSTFSEKLNHIEQYLHFGSMILLVWSMAFLMAPAAFHRRSRPEVLTRRWITLSSTLMAWGMNFFMIAVAVETYLIAVGLGLSFGVGLGVSVSVLLTFMILWVICPRTFVR